MSVSSRRKGRLVAFQTAYTIDISQTPLEECLKTAIAEAELNEAAAEFTSRLIRGVGQHRTELDAIIEKHAKGYTLERLAAVDRAILRVALYELLHEEDTPNAVVINEAVELAKKYSTEESGAFINGILGTCARELHGNPT